MMTFEAEYYEIGLLDNIKNIMMNITNDLYKVECEYCGRENEFYKTNAICECGCPLNIKKSTKIDQSQRVGASGVMFANYPTMNWPVDINYNSHVYNSVVNKAINIVKKPK